MSHRCFLRADLSTELQPVIRAFEASAAPLRSDSIRSVHEVRDLVRPHLVDAGWVVGEGDRNRGGGVVLRTSQGPPLRADAVNRPTRAVLWIETGRSWSNNGFLEHLVRPTVCLEVEHIAIALRAQYKGEAYQKCVDVLQPIFDAGRLGLPYESLVLLSF